MTMRGRVIAVLFVVVALMGAGVRAQGWVDRTGPNGPPAFWSAPSMAHDPVNSQVVLVGFASQGVQTWTWDGISWAHRHTKPAGSTNYVRLVWRASTNQMVLVEVSAGSAPGSVQFSMWNGAGWSSLESVGIPTLSYSSMPIPIAAGFDPARNELVVLVGPQHVVVWDGATAQFRAATSPTALVANYQAPWASGIHPGMSWDPIAQRLVVAGTGEHWIWIGASLVSVPIAHFYEWNGHGWMRRLPANAPLMLSGGMATDPISQRILLLDGDQTGPAALSPNHTWTYSNGTLTQLNTPLAPAPRWNSCMAFDAGRSRFVLFGGQSLSGGHYYTDTWEFQLGAPASITSYGAGCVGSRGIPSLTAQPGSTPRMGTTLQMNIQNLPWTGPAFLVLGVSDSTYQSTALPFDLTPIGAPGCFLRTSIDQIDLLTNVLGSASWSWTVPLVPGGVFHAQVLPLDPTANTLGLTTSNGARGVIGF
jgi:hypothetical protein